MCCQFACNDECLFISSRLTILMVLWSCMVQSDMIVLQHRRFRQVKHKQNGLKHIWGSCSMIVIDWWAGYCRIITVTTLYSICILRNYMTGILLDSNAYYLKANTFNNNNQIPVCSCAIWHIVQEQTCFRIPACFWMTNRRCLKWNNQFILTVGLHA